MPAEIYSIEEFRSRRIEDARTRMARKFWGAEGEEIHLAFERTLMPKSDTERALVDRLASYWEALSLKTRVGAKAAAVGSALPPAA